MQNDGNNKITVGNDIIEKARSLYEFLLKFSELKHPAIINLNSCAKKSIDEFPEDPVNIRINYCDTVAESASEEPSEELPLLVIHKPEFDRCPPLPEELNGWIANGWNDYRKEEIEKFNCRYKSTNLPVFGEVGDENDMEYFDDDVYRSEVLNRWLKKRIDWVNRQKSIAKTRRLFEVFYDFHMGMQRDSENLELIVANGFIESAEHADVKYPFLSKKVRTEFNARKSEICVYNDDSNPELYSNVFEKFDDMHLEHLSDLKKSLELHAYHPLDRNEAPGFLKEVINTLTTHGLYCEQEPNVGWKKDYHYICYWKPIYVLRPRPDGSVRVIHRIIENINNKGYVPPHIIEIIAPGQVQEESSEKEESFVEKLASIGGESTEVLLAKEANRKQLNIAKRIEQNNAVVVQGPPGTGKTHTIANLLGHFLAQGKSVLVTSFTTKALKVLKEKVPEKIQPLCVSVIDDDKAEIMRSVNGITNWMTKDPTELKEQMKSLDLRRQTILSKLCELRQKLFSIRNQERQTITYNGESLSPSAVADFVSQNENTLNYIPGNITIGHPLPLALDDLITLYRTNTDISLEESSELARQLPNPQSLLSPEEFEAQTTLLQRLKAAIESFSEKTSWTFAYNNDTQSISLSMDEHRCFHIPKTDTTILDELLSISERFKELEPWMKHAAVDGRDNGNAKKKWYVLIDQISELCKLSEQFDLEKFGKELSLPILDGKKRAEFLADISAMYKIRDNGATIGKLKLLLNPRWKKTLAMVTINGKSVSEAADFKIILDSFTLEEKRKDCARYWDQLIQKAGGKSFFELGSETPETIARNFIDLIKKHTEWYQTDYEPLNKILSLLAIDAELFFGFTRLDSDLQRTDKIFHTVFSDIKPLVEICRLLLAKQDIINIFSNLQNELRKNERCQSIICSELSKSIDKLDTGSYREAFIALKETYDKYTVLEKRNHLIEELRPFAPEWADAIHHRLGIHGRGNIPDNIQDAWRWKQYSAILDNLLSEDYDALQKRITELVSKYHELTAEYVATSAWFHLIKRTEKDRELRTSLMGWAKTVELIGPTNTLRSITMRQAARRLMPKCQRAVPAWIMPISKAMSNLDPIENRFDVIIVDEASQADITTLAIAYMAKKIIIVGDDKQVTPISVGIQYNKVKALITEYLKGHIKNPDLYDERSSIYGIAKTTYTILMLEEHFRCVPEIIGFSNMLSYNNLIKPLRDPTTSILLPHVVNFRVTNGIRNGNVNDNEAKTIVALMKACLEQEEYANKSFGVIAMLGAEQALSIQKIIAERIALHDIEERRILCGEPPNFQGDERDVIFLSLVDNGNGKGPLRFLGLDANMNMQQKRYNVATSRPKDQLWVVHSLDPANDLQNGDIRKILIDYANAPESFIVKTEDIERHTESPFEKEVAKALIARGFHIEPQYPVGAYRIDFVVKYQGNELAFECDGERYHRDLYADMERQQILERLGWRFVRLRGGEYYRNKEKSIDRVVSDFNALGIFPEQWNEATKSASRSSELLERVKTRAAAILKEWEEEEKKETETSREANYHNIEEDHTRTIQRTQLDLFGNEII